MSTQTFIAAGKNFGASPRGFVVRHAEAHSPHSYAFFCPVCGEVWARAPVEDGGKMNQFLVLTRRCRQHSSPDPIDVPGSLFVEWDEAFNEAMPDQLILEWELPRHLDYAEEFLL
jgi:hypothetical protein